MRTITSRQIVWLLASYRGVTPESADNEKLRLISATVASTAWQTRSTPLVK
jgi:hypothetical protein